MIPLIPRIEKIRYEYVDPIIRNGLTIDPKYRFNFEKNFHLTHVDRRIINK